VSQIFDGEPDVGQRHTTKQIPYFGDLKRPVRRKQDGLDAQLELFESQGDGRFDPLDNFDF
jgi:hypothetical protein